MPTKTLPFHHNGHQFTREPMPTVEVMFIEFEGETPHTYLNRSRMSYSCFKCGGYEFEERITEDGVYFDGEPCPVPDEGITTVITLNVPSGKIIVKDDLRPVYNGFDGEGFAPYNSNLGQAQVIEAFAKQGCAFGPVGNTCPSLYRTGEGTYVLANLGYDPESEYDTFPVPVGWTALASVCTDRWAYSIADYDDFLAKGGTPEIAQDSEIVEVPAGVYQFTHHTLKTGFDSHSADTVIFADIKKIA